VQGFFADDVLADDGEAWLIESDKAGEAETELTDAKVEAEFETFWKQCPPPSTTARRSKSIAGSSGMERRGLGGGRAQSPDP
jgi:hypothetical protein